MYIIVRKDTPDSAPSYYMGNGQWSSSRREAKLFPARQASMICESFVLRQGWNVSFVKA